MAIQNLVMRRGQRSKYEYVITSGMSEKERKSSKSLVLKEGIDLDEKEEEEKKIVDEIDHPERETG